MSKPGLAPHRGRWTRAWLVAILAAPSCSQASYTKTSIVGAEGRTVPVTKMRFRVSVDGAAPIDQDPFKVTSDAGSTKVEFGSFGGKAQVRLFVWADLDGDGARSEGDLEGELAEPVTVEDRGLCAGNMTRTPDIVLRPIQLRPAPQPSKPSWPSSKRHP